MATGDALDFVSRLKAVLPRGWFPDDSIGTPILDATLSGHGVSWEWLYSLLAYVRAQRRLTTATGINLDFAASDFFGTGFPRLGSENDAAYRARVKAELFSPKGTREGVTRVIHALTGFDPVIFEPADASDTGGYGHLGGNNATYLGYASGDASVPGMGGYGSLLLPFQAFITVFRPHGGGIPNAQGYYALNSGAPAFGGYGVGALQYVALDLVSGVVTDEDIYTAITNTAPAGSVMWARVSDKTPTGSGPIASSDPLLNVNFVLDVSKLS